MKLLDGKALSEQIKEEIAQEVRAIKKNNGKTPHLAAVLVGNDGASETYVSNKVKSCEYVGFRSSLFREPESISEEELIRLITRLNEDEDIDGFIVQLPLPAHINERNIVMAIEPAKDVDGFHPVNVGRMVQGLPSYLPATPFGILQLLERNQIGTEGKHCVILGRSNIVGMPMGILMARKGYPGNCTVTICHSRTVDIPSITRQADIIVAAIGIPEFLRGDMVREGAVVVDVGITRVADPTKKRGYTLKGDVAFDEVSPKCSYITPVPGGVGPMTVTSLLMNTLKASRREIYP